MKLVKAAKGRFNFQIEEKEKRALFQVLKLYPLIPASYQKLSREATSTEDQQLLEEALAEKRAQNQKQLLAMMEANSGPKGSNHLSLHRSEMEWLLQVLNDVRVGSWLTLGSPDGPRELFAALNEKTAAHFWAMEVAGQFQVFFLQAMNDAGESASAD